MKPILKKFGPDSKYERSESGLRTTVHAQLCFQVEELQGVRRSEDKGPAGGVTGLPVQKPKETFKGDWIKERTAGSEKEEKKSKKEDKSDKKKKKSKS